MRFLDTRDQRRFSPEKLQKTNLFETAQMFCDVYCLEPGQQQKPHAHAGASKLYYVIEGRGTFLVGEERAELGPGGLAWAEPGEPHGVENRSGERLVLLVAMAPNPNVPGA
jgi:quercetin dioxygenase-like cupin family protein